MKRYFRYVVFLGMLVMSLCILPQLAKAIGNPDEPGDDPDAPIDGGVGLLVAAGVAYGVKRVKAERKKNLDNQA